MSPVVVSSPKSERIMASTYTRPGKAMIIVLNDTDNDEVIELNIDMAKTVPGKARITAKDGYSNENITIANNVIKISVPNREFRIIILE